MRWIHPTTAYAFRRSQCRSQGSLLGGGAQNLKNLVSIFLNTFSGVVRNLWFCQLAIKKSKKTSSSVEQNLWFCQLRIKILKQSLYCIKQSRDFAIKKYKKLILLWAKSVFFANPKKEKSYPALNKTCGFTNWKSKSNQ